MNLNKIVVTLVTLVLIVSSCMVAATSKSINVSAGKQQVFSGSFDGGRDKTYTKASSYSELVSWYQALEDEYPDYVQVFKANQVYGLGQVNGGYDDYYVRITNENTGFHKPEVLFLGSPHGDETVGTNCLYWFVDWLLRMALTDEPCYDYSKSWLNWLLDNREIYIEVAHNPYGYDHGPQRYDGHGWDLNREADYDGPGSPTGGIWGSVPGKTLYHFVNDHQIRAGGDFHGGTRELLYPWSSNHDSVYGTSPISGKTFSHAPPDFYFYDAASLRLGDYIGDYGGDLNENNIGTIPDTVGYEAPGGMTPWGYGADVVSNPAEDDYVNDEIYGNYPGSGIFWVTPEWSYTKNEPDSTYGGDNDPKYGAGVRRYCLFMADIAQPYVNLLEPSGNVWVAEGTPLTFRWQVNGSMVVDHTYLQWGTDPDPVHHYDYQTSDYDEHAGDWVGGTGWDNADDGQTSGVTYEETVSLTETGSYYFVVKAQVDQVYGSVIHPEVYGDTPYLRLIKERTDPGYHEVVNGADGTEEINGQVWWYSPVIHVAVGEDNLPPVTTLSVHGVEGDNGWYINLPKVELLGEDDLSGVNYTMYRVNGGEWQVYSGPISADQGVNVVDFYSVDYAGNVEEVKSGSFKVDYTPPYTQVILGGSHGEPGWCDGSVVLNAVDNYSGVSQVFYRLDGQQTWSLYDGPVELLDDGVSHTLEFYSVDYAGVAEDVRSRVFTVDLVSPSVSLVYPVGGEVLMDEVDVRWVADDDKVAPRIEVAVSSDQGETWSLISGLMENDGVFTWDTLSVPDGGYRLKVTAFDGAGNEASVSSGDFFVRNHGSFSIEVTRPELGYVYSLWNSEGRRSLFLTAFGRCMYLFTDVVVSARSEFVDEVNFVLERADGVVVGNVTVSSESDVYTVDFGVQPLGSYVLVADALVNGEVVASDRVAGVLSLST